MIPLALLAVVLLSACATAGVSAPEPTSTPAATFGSVVVREVWSRPTFGFDHTEHSGTQTSDSEGPTASDQTARLTVTGAVYLTIQNTGDDQERLLRAQTEVAENTELHVAQTNDGIAQMRPVAGVDIPARGEVVFKPGGLHLMLIGVARELRPGDHFPVTLLFKRAGSVTVQVTVRE